MTYEEYLKTLEADSSITTSSDEEESKIIMIDTTTRQIKITKGMEILGVTDDHKSDHVYFYIPRYYNDVDLFTKQLIIKYINANNEYGEYVVSDMSLITYPEDSTETDNYISFSWLVEQGSTLYRGALYFSAQFQELNGTDVEYILQTVPARFYIKSGIKPTNSKVCRTDTTFLQLQNKIDSYETEMTTIKTNVDTITSQITTDEEKITTLTTTLATVSDTVDYQSTTIQSIANELASLQASYNTLSAQVTSNAEHIKLIEDAGWVPPDVSQKLVEIQTRLDALEGKDVHYTDEK